MPKQITDVKNKLLDAAEKILKTEGYEALSMRKIAKECSIAVGTVYNYVQNKEELVALVMMEDWTQALSDMAGCVQKSESVTQGMCGIYQALQSFVEKYRDVWTQYSQMGGSSSAISSHHMILRSQIDEQIQKLMENFEQQQLLGLSPLLAEMVLAAAMQPDMNEGLIREMMERLLK